MTGTDRSSDLEFTDGGYIVEFLCRPDRSFHLYNDPDDDREEGPVDDPDPATPVLVE